MTFSGPLPMVAIGRDLPVTQFGLGTIQFTGDPDRWGPPHDIEQATQVLRAAVEAGITHIDTTPRTATAPTPAKPSSPMPFTPTTLHS